MNRLLVAIVAMAFVAAACGTENNAADGGTTTDGGVTTDAGVTDGGESDAGVTDGGVADGGESDAGVTDGGQTDGGNGSTGTATITGAIPGANNFAAHDAISTVDPDNNNGAIVAITDFAGACADAQANTLHAGDQVLALQLRNQVTGQTQPLAAGTYNVTTSTTAQDGMTVIAALLTAANQTCDLNATNVATGGTVTLTTANPTAGNGVDGTFSLEFPASGPITTVTGTFTAPFCDESNAPATTTCQ